MEANLDEANPEWIQARYDHLNLIEEKSLVAVHHGKPTSKTVNTRLRKESKAQEVPIGRNGN